jgi:hypothetical protein
LAHEYDAARAAKADAELSFYSRQLEILRGALGGTVLSDPAVKEIPVEQSVAYGRILVAAQRDAILLAETLALSSAPPTPWSALIGFLEKGLRDDRDAFVDSMRRQQELRTGLLQALGEIDRQDQRLRAVRDQLLRLEQAPSLKANVDELIAIGDAIRKQLQQRRSE